MLALALVVSAMSRPALAQAQEISDQDKAMHYSLYYEDFKNENFASALPNLSWVIENAPEYPRNDDRNFERLWKAYEGLAENADDADMSRAYLDSALAVFETAPAALEERGLKYDPYEWAFNLGRFVQRNADQLPDVSAAESYIHAFEIDAARLQPYYFEYIISDFVQSQDKGGAVDFMDTVEAEVGDNGEIMAIVTKWRNNLFTDPEERMTFLEDQLAKKPGDQEIIQELFDIYRELGYRDKMYAMGDQLQDMEPTAGTLTLLAKLRLEDGEAEEALELYQRALELPGAQKNAREIYYNMGIAQQELGRLSKARTNFREALQADADFGAAYIAIGDLYVAAVRNCGSMEREDRAVYWLATDYYERARSVDPAMANVATQKIRSIRPYYPDAEALFFKGWKPGQAYPVSGSCYGWIGETTQVRQP